MHISAQRKKSITTHCKYKKFLLWYYAALPQGLMWVQNCKFFVVAML